MSKTAFLILLLSSAGLFAADKKPSELATTNVVDRRALVVISAPDTSTNYSSRSVTPPVLSGGLAPYAAVLLASDYGLQGGAGVEESSHLSAALHAVDLLAGAPVRLIIRSTNGVNPIYINQRITMAASNAIMDWQSPVIFGTNGSIRLMGEPAQTTRGATYQGALGVAAAAGSTLLILSNSTSRMQASNFVAGDAIIIRGQNDAYGNALWHETLHVTTVYASSNTLQVAEELEFWYATVFSNSFYTPDSGGLDRSTVVALKGSPLTISSPTNSIYVTVDSNLLTSSGIGAGSLVMLSTTETEYDINTNAVTTVGNPYKNSARIEIKTVASATNGVVTFDSPTVDYYATNWQASVIVILPPRNSSIRGVRATYLTNSASTSIHAIDLDYAYQCSIENCHVDGRGGQKGNGIRVSRSSECVVSDSKVSYPLFLDSGQGYGFSVYYADRNKVVNCSAEGCRHNFIVQKGNHTQFINCDSINEGVSGFDVHGVRSFNTLFTACRAFGGPLHSPNVDNKSAFRVGNSSHANGDYGTVIEGCFVTGFVDTNSTGARVSAGLETFAMSTGVALRNSRFVDCAVGVRMGNNAQFDAIGVTNIVIDGNEFQRCENIFDADGNSSFHDVQSVIVSRNTSIQNSNHFSFRYCDGLKVIGNRVLQPVSLAGVYAYDFNRCKNLVLHGNEAYGANRGISINSCTNAAVYGNRMIALTEGTNFLQSGTSIHLDDGGLMCVMSTNIASTGFSNLTAVATTAPSIAEGQSLVFTNYTARSPGRMVKVTAIVPYMTTSASDNATLHIFVGTNCVGSSVVRIQTTGASSGTGMACMATYTASGYGEDIDARLGPKTAGTILTVADKFTSGPNLTGAPYMLIEEMP